MMHCQLGDGHPHAGLSCVLVRPACREGRRWKTEDGTHDLCVGAQPQTCRSQVGLSDHRTARAVGSGGSQSELEFTSAAVQLGPRREASPFFWSDSGSGAAGEASAVSFVAEQGNVHVAPTNDTGEILVITSHTRHLQPSFRAILGTTPSKVPPPALAPQSALALPSTGSSTKLAPPTIDADPRTGSA